MPFLTLLILIAVAIFPALVWLVFFLREDIHPEPRKLITHTFMIGAFATAPALLLQIGLKNIVDPSHVIVMLVGLALIEEVWKFLAAYYAINKSPFFDEPIDAMIYMVVAAAGFATVENVLIALGSVGTAHAPLLIDATNILLLRFVGATLLHILASATVGYYWARGRQKKLGGGLILQGLIIATIIHFAFNYLIATFQDTNLIYASIIPIVAAFFVLNDFEALKKSDTQPIQ